MPRSAGSNQRKTEESPTNAGWCCDGVHCAGDAPHFAGILPQMNAVCKAFDHYDRADLTDKWRTEFQCYDGLTLQKAAEVQQLSGWSCCMGGQRSASSRAINCTKNVTVSHVRFEAGSTGELRPEIFSVLARLM